MVAPYLSPTNSVEIFTLSRADRSRTRHYPPRIDGRSRPARRVKALIKAYTERLGETAGEPFTRAKIIELAECETLCEALRAAALTGQPVDILALNRLTGTARRLRADLHLDGQCRRPPQRRWIVTWSNARQHHEADLVRGGLAR
jgi:hypothetical protein